MNSCLNDIDIIIEAFTKIKTQLKYYNDEVSKLYADLIAQENVCFSLRKLEELQNNFINSIHHISSTKLSNNTNVLYFTKNNNYKLDVKKFHINENFSYTIPSIKINHDSKRFNLEFIIFEYNIYDDIVEESKYTLNPNFNRKINDVKVLMEYYKSIKSKKLLLNSIDMILKNYKFLRRVNGMHFS